MMGAPLDMAAYSVAPQSVLAPLGALGLILNLVVAPRLHGEALARHDVSATALVILGTLLCLVGGASSTPAEGTASMKEGPGVQALQIYATCVTVGVAALGALLVALRNGPSNLEKSESALRADAVASASLAGLLGSSTVVASKVITFTLASSDVTIGRLLRSLAPITIAAPTHLYVLNSALGHHSLVFLAPVSGAAALLCNVITGFLLYGETPVAPVPFVAGLLLLISGALLLCTRQAQPPPTPPPPGPQICIEALKAE